MIKFRYVFIAIMMVTGFMACEPDTDDKIALGEAPVNADFTITEDLANPNTYILENTTPGAFIYNWDFGNGTKKSGAKVSAFYQKKGDYVVILTVANAGGHKKVEKTITVPEDAPINCEDNEVLEFLSDCGQKVWKLNPDAGALWVGPADGSQTWWQNQVMEIDVRPCAWNDEWTFTDDLKMIYDTKGDLWAEDYMGFPFQCVDENLLADNVKPWASGTHSYTVLTEGGVNTLSVNGLGAFIGLPKATNGAEVKLPVSSITYTISKMEKRANEDFLEIFVNFGPGIWRFQLVSK